MIRPGRLSLRWSHSGEHGVSTLNGAQGDILYEWGDGCQKADSALLHYVMAHQPYAADEGVFGRSFLEELHARGYDLRTLKFSIYKRVPE